MNREIKFRAWDKEFNRITDGNWLNDENLAISLNGELFSLEYKKGGENGSWTKYKDIANRFTLMEFTGLKDKNGADIYEGDIVKYKDLFDEDRVGYIYWEAPTYVMRNKIRDENIPIWKGGEGHIRQWKDGTHDWESIENLNTFNIEVIGNIFQNSNLLNNK